MRARAVTAVVERGAIASGQRGTRRPGRDYGSYQPRGVGAERFVEVQRSRLLAGASSAIAELGYTETTIADIIARARVSRRTFYQLFADREACLAMLIAEVVRSLEAELAAAGLESLPWRERMRGGLLRILAFLDSEPALARIVVIEALRGDPRVLELREEAMARLAVAVDAGRGESAQAARCTMLTAEGVVGAVFTTVYRRLLRGEHKPLTRLVGELMGMIALPYLGPAAARREQARSAPTGRGRRVTSAPTATLVADPLCEAPMRLTYRTLRVLECIGESPEISNREVAERAGIADAGQTSKLMARLERLGLVANTGGGHSKGAPNAWRLTPLAAQVVERLSAVGETPGRVVSGAPRERVDSTDRNPPHDNRGAHAPFDS
jgi:AcrR family transcriptional regulator